MVNAPLTRRGVSLVDPVPRGPLTVTASLFPELDGLFGLSRYDGVDVRPTLLRVLTDLYVQKLAHSAEEERYYTELALRLIEAVDLPTRKSIADRLVRYPSAPTAVIQRLKRDVVDFPIAEASSASADTRALSEADGQREFDAIRATLARGERPRQTASAPMRTRTPDLAPPSLSDSFFDASVAARRAIFAHLDASDTPLPPSPPPADTETLRRLEGAVLGGRPDLFIAELEKSLNISRAAAQRVVNDVSGEPMVIAAKALAMPLDVLQRILLFLNPAIGHSVERVYTLSALYDELSLGATLRLLARWRDAKLAQAQTQRGGVHYPVHYDDETRSARESAIPTARQMSPGARDRFPAPLSERRQRTT
jgi:hypothetical protein